MSIQPKKTSRIRIIEAATDLIFKEGLYNVTYLKIANQAGLTHPAIYKHFKDMDELIGESCVHWVDEAKSFIDLEELETLKAKDQLMAYVERNLKYTHKNQKKDALLFGLYYQALHSPKLMKIYLSFEQAAIKRLEVYIQRGNYEKAWFVKDAGKSARTMHAYIVGEIIKLIINPKDEKIEDRISRVSGQFLSTLIKTGN